MDRDWPMLMRLHIIKDGSFCTAAQEEEDCPMDEAVWSKLPEALMWEVLRFVPALKLFQLQLVSPKWRQVFTSTKFRKTIVAKTAPARGGSDSEAQQQQPGVVACVDVDVLPGGSNLSTSKGSKMMDIDLCSFVPASFWAPATSSCDLRSYAVVAAASGLVCISSKSELLFKHTWNPWGLPEHEAPRPPGATDHQYCVINPLTRTSTVLPPVPFPPRGWLPPTASAVTVYATEDDETWKVATYDLAAGSWAVTAHRPWFRQTEPGGVTALGGDTYGWDVQTGKLCVLAGAAAPRALKEPAEAMLGLDSLDRWARSHARYLVAHRGALFYVAQLWRRTVHGWYERSPDRRLLCGVWRLAMVAPGGQREEWVEVARLRERDVERLTGARFWRDFHSHDFPVFGPYGVREFICCCEVQAYRNVNGAPGRVQVLVGVNLDTGEWESVHELEERFGPCEDQRVEITALCQDGKAFELRPDLFLV